MAIRNIIQSAIQEKAKEVPVFQTMAIDTVKPT